MTFLTPLTLAIALASPQAEGCTLSPGTRTQQRSFTNADLERMAACRQQSSEQSQASVPSEGPHRSPERKSKATAGSAAVRRDDAEADWRAQWRSVDQKARKLRREARELRQEASESPRDPKKRVVGRRSPSLLLTRAEALESEARDLEDQFAERARREGALPGWIRPKGR